MKERLVNDRYTVIVPDHIADWDAPSEWERVRFLSMEQHLKQGMVLYDIGTEQGWQSAIYAQFVGGENMVLVEPDHGAWPNIRQTWQANDLKLPKGYFLGCFGNKTNNEVFTGMDWPGASEGKLQTSFGYGSLNQAGDVIKLDDYVAATEIIPDALTIDVEGGELEVLKGAKKTLKKHQPLLWISVHPDLMEKDYQTTQNDLVGFLVNFGYGIENLGWDGHETHWYCHD